jgi:Protein of unknown function (DUF3096)
VPGGAVPHLIGASCSDPFPRNKLARTTKPIGNPMVITAAHITPLVALVAGILILIMPRLLNIIVAVYLIIVGLTGLNAIHHFVN